MIIQNGLSLSDRINLRQTLSFSLQDLSNITDLNSLSEDEKESLRRWWLLNTKRKDEGQSIESVFGEIQKHYHDSPQNILSDLKYTLGDDPIKDAFVDAALVGGLVDEMRDKQTAQDAASQVAGNQDTKAIIDKLIKRKMTENMIKVAHQNRIASSDGKSISLAIEQTDPKSSSTSNSAGSYTSALNEVSSVVNSLTSGSGVEFSATQKEIIALQLAAMSAAGSLDLTNPQELAIHFAVTAAEVNPSFADQNSIAQLYEDLDETVREAKSEDIDDSLTAAAQNKQAKESLSDVNEQIHEQLLNQTTPDIADKQTAQITRELTNFISENPQASPEEIEDFINKQTEKITDTDGEIKIDPKTLQTLAQVNHPKVVDQRASYTQLVLTDALSGSDLELDDKKLDALARDIAQKSTYQKQTDAQLLDHIIHEISAQTGADPEKVREQLEGHSAQLQRIKQINQATTVINIPAGIAIDTDKIKIKNEAEIKKAIAASLANVQNLSPKDIDRILNAQKIVDLATKNLGENKDFQIVIRRFDTSTIYSKEQNEIYKAFFEAYKNDLERSRPTQRGVETIVLITALPHQTIISPTAVALTNMGITVDMFDKLIKDPSKSPSFALLMKNHKNQMALLRDQLEQLEGSKLYQDLAPTPYDQLKNAHEFTKLSTRDAALTTFGGEYGKSLARTYNSSIVNMMGSFVAPRFIPLFNTIFHPFERLQDYATARAGQAMARVLLGGKTLSQAIGSLIVRGLAKLGVKLALGAATAGVGLVLGFAADAFLKPFASMARDLFGEDVTIKDFILAPITLLGTGLMGLVSLVTVTSVLSSGLLAVGASSVLLGLFIYITSFVMAPILSTIVHLESGQLGTATKPFSGQIVPYSGEIIDGCNPIWPTNSGNVIQGPKAGFSHSRVEAIDIKVPTGTQVYSISNGTVIFNAYYNVYGNNLRIQSIAPNGRTYDVWYGHLAAPSHLKVGDTVKIGDPIAFSGATSSNRSFANPHLHLEYRGMLYNECPAGGVPVPYGCYNWVGYTWCNIRF